MTLGKGGSAELCRPANLHSFGVTQAFFPDGCAQISSYTAPEVRGGRVYAMKDFPEDFFLTVLL